MSSIGRRLSAGDSGKRPPVASQPTGNQPHGRHTKDIFFRRFFALPSDCPGCFSFPGTKAQKRHECRAAALERSPSATCELFSACVQTSTPGEWEICFGISMRKTKKESSTESPKRE